MPLLTKRHSIFVDYHEQVYARSIFSLGCQAHASARWGMLSAEVCQPFSLHTTTDVFATSPFAKYIMPLIIDVSYSLDEQLSLYTRSEIDVTRSALATTASGFRFNSEKYSASLGLMYEHPQNATTRSLLMQGGSFLQGEVCVPLAKRIQLNYAGQWNFDVKKNDYALLSHQIDVAYKGHCWSIRCGYQEKGYMHYGRYKQEQSVYMLFSFDALGSLQTRVKRWWQRW